MDSFISWNSQSLQEWTEKFAKGQIIEINGNQTHYIDVGQGDPLILLHGFFLDSYTWSKNVKSLSDHYKVYVPDLWGFGYSTREPVDYGYQLYVDQLLGFMDTLGIERASLVGHSMGGGTAILFTVQNRDRVNRLILVDPAGMPSSLPLRAKLFNLPGVGEFLMQLNTDAFRRKNLADLWIHEMENMSDHDFDNLMRFQKIEGSTEVILSILRKQFFHTLGDEIIQLAKLDFPVMLVWGREEKNIPLERGKAMHQILDGSRLEIVEAAGHMPNFERPETFNGLAIDFLES
ncbi:MAG: alpha/beta hydrolase [Anaerolineales bacterium]|nr:MAG: alpha/beta hydrolase [Anaerolineales bacterium]